MCTGRLQGGKGGGFALGSGDPRRMSTWLRMVRMVRRNDWRRVTRLGAPSEQSTGARGSRGAAGVPAGNIAIDGDRMWATIMETAQIGATPKGGICRLTLTDLDRQVRDWFRAACEAAGCVITVDDMGNIFARRAGRDPTLPPIAIGSHLDTQPTGGKYDGIIGVLTGLEVLRTLNDQGYETNAPIEVIDWTNEEGSRFAPAMLSSGVFAGVFDTAYAYAREDREGKQFGAELTRIGYQGDVPCGSHALGAHFELHIEQGPILEAEQKTIGVVTGVQGMRWYEVNVTGMEGHAGATPMKLRRDALVGASRMVAAINRIGWDHAPDAVATVGLLESRPNSRNVVPGSVFFTIDLRHPSDAGVAAMEAETRQTLERIAAERRGDHGRVRVGFAGSTLRPRLHRVRASRGGGCGLPQPRDRFRRRT